VIVTKTPAEIEKMAAAGEIGPIANVRAPSATQPSSTTPTSTDRMSPRWSL